MSKVIVMEITFCCACPHFQIIAENNICMLKEKTILDVFVVPKWCPLEDAKND